MLLNRRTMLSAGIGAVALSLSGCKKTKTTVVFVNASSSATTISATAGGFVFSAKNVQPGHQVKKIYRTNGKLGTAVPVTGTVVFKTAPAPTTFNLAGNFLSEGYTNTITATDPADVMLTVS